MQNFEITKLNSGIRVITHHMLYVESVVISVWVKTGSRSEDESNSGISHFLEHMAFKGTPTRTARDIAEAFDNIGGKVNAFTSAEVTCYYAKVLKDDSEKATEILADIFQNSIFPEEEVTKEKDVVLQEISMVNDTPNEIIFDYFQNTAFPNQPAGMPILGTEKNVRSFSSFDLKNYVKDKYKTGNIVISFAGNIKHKYSLELVNRYFCNLSKGEENIFQKANYIGGLFHKQKDELEQVHIIIGFRGKSYKDEEYYHLNLLSSILGGGMSSRLFQRIREELGLVYSIYSFSSSDIDCGLFGIYAGTTPENLDKVVNASGEELLKIAEKIEEEELSRSLAQFKASLLMSMESSISMSQKIGSDILCFGKVRTKEEILDKLNSITTKDLKDSMEKLLDGGARTISSIGSSGIKTKIRV
ncbi:M16 family metallopeptidase [Pseudomonadota bacterium]